MASSKANKANTKPDDSKGKGKGKKKPTQLDQDPRQQSFYNPEPEPVKTEEAQATVTVEELIERLLIGEARIEEARQKEGNSEKVQRAETNWMKLLHQYEKVSDQNEKVSDQIKGTEGEKI